MVLALALAEGVSLILGRRTGGRVKVLLSLILVEGVSLDRGRRT